MSRGWPRTSLPRWWRSQSLRTRLVIASVVPLAVALAVGTVALTAVFAAGRVDEVDGETLREADVLAGLVSSSQLPQPLPLPAGSSLLAQVVDAEGTVVAATASASRVLPLATGVPGGRADRLGTEEDPAFGDVPLRLRSRAARLGDRPVALVVAAPLGDVRRAVQALRLVLLVVVPALVVLATLLARALVGSALRPVEQLRTAAADLAGSPAGGGRLPVGNRDDEVGRLARTLNALLRRQQDSLAQQRAFVADAAHELRSPLASMRVQLDVARAHPELSEAGELAGGLQADVERLQALADDLLLLARLESRTPLRRDPVDLTELAGRAAGHAPAAGLRPVAPFAGVAPTAGLAGAAPATGLAGAPEGAGAGGVEPAPIVVLGDRAALERMVRNLLDNARRAATTVQVGVSLRDGRAVLDVDDDGPGIASPDRERVFDRWVRLDDGRSRGQGGSGLGLALVREIAAAHGGEVSVLDSPLGGARLQVVLPAERDES